MKRYIKYIIIVVVAIIAIVGYTIIHKNSTKPEWRTDNPSRGTIREVVTATGSINPYVLVEVGTEVSGKIEKLYKDFNDTVRKGELLAKLDTEILSANLESAKAEVTKAAISVEQTKLDFDTNKALQSRDMIAQYDVKKSEFAYKQAQQSLANAQLTLQRAQKNLQNAYITSPINGVIVARSVDEGQTVAASMSSPTLFKIANNLDQMQITANVDEADIGKIKVNMPVEFSVDAYSGEDFTGTVKQIRLNSTTEQNVVSYSVIIDTVNPEHKLLPGMTTNVTIVVQSKDDVLRIPETATRFVPSKEIWELFGLKWEDNLITNARKKAMETAMKKFAQSAQGPSGKPALQDSTGKQGVKRDSSAVRGRGQSRRRGMSGGFSGGGFPSSGGGFSRAGGRSGMSMIWVLKDKTPELIMVRTGVSDGAYLEVLGELDANTKIITGVNYKDASQVTGNSAIQGRQGGMGPRF